MGTDMQVGPYWLTITFLHFDTTHLWLTHISLLPSPVPIHTFLLLFALFRLMIFIYRCIQFYYYPLALGCLCLYIARRSVNFVKATLFTSKFGLVYQLPLIIVDASCISGYLCEHSIPEEVQYPLSNV